MPNAVFAKMVLAGLQIRGFSDAEIADLVKRLPETVPEGKNGSTDLPPSALRRIERAAAMTCGQLAALAAEPSGGSLTDLMNEWAKLPQQVGTKAGPPTAVRGANS